MPWQDVAIFLGGVITGLVSLSVIDLALHGWEERER